MISLCLEVYIILRFKAYSTSKIRLAIYNFTAIALPSLIVLTFALTKSLGETVFHTCFIQTGSMGQYLDIFFHLFLILLLITSYILIKKQLGCCYAPVFHHLTRVILVLTITVTISRALSLLLLFQRLYFSARTDFIVIFGSISTIICGFTVSLSRIFHPKVRFKLRELCGFQEKEPENEPVISGETREQLLKSILSVSLDAASDDLADMFEHLGHKIIIQILVLLTIKYRVEEDQCLDLNQALADYRGRKEQKDYNERMYAELAHELCMPFIDKVFCPDVMLIEYESGIFEMIRKATGFDRAAMIESLLSYDNLKTLAQINNKGGKSNSFFYTSSNEKIVIKTINCQECASFLRFLPAYSKRVINHPESKLIRILGLFRILPHKQDFIIMENAIVKRNDCYIYDLKGSTVDRYVGGINSEDPPCGMVLKDLNFKRLDKKIRIKNRDLVIKSIIKDMKILSNCKLMDYSMLVGIYEYLPNSRYAFGDCYSIAIIDFFQRYGFKKSMERFLKRYVLRKDKGISVISPYRYFKRIKKYLRSISEEATND